MMAAAAFVLTALPTTAQEASTAGLTDMRQSRYAKMLHFDRCIQR